MVFRITDIVEYTRFNIQTYDTEQSMKQSALADRRRRARENDIIRKTKPCTMERDIYAKLDHIRANDLTNLYNDQFYSEGFMRYLADISCPIFYPMSSDGELVKDWFRDFKKIGEESVEGVAITASLSNHDNLFVIKGPRGKSSDLAHEAVVGLALNPLRELIPNFSWVFGVVRCGIPITDKDRLLSWCTADDPVTYVIYERVPGTSLREFIRTANANDMKDVYLQILQSLHMADRLCQFTHYDLHYDNIIVRPLKQQSTIVYDLGTVTHNHQTTNIATFIDYGFAHAVYQGQHYGRYDFKAYSILPEQSYPLFDAFKLLCFCLEEATRSNTSLIPTLVEILSFFTPDSYVDLLNNIGPRSGLFYSLPYQLGSTLTLDRLITHVMRGVSFITTTPQAKVLRCNMAGTCLDHDSISHFMGLDDGNDVRSINAYLIALKYGRLKPGDQERFRRLFGAQLYSDAYRRIKSQQIAVSDLLQYTKPVVLFNQSRDAQILASNLEIASRNLRNSRNRELYRNYVNNVVDIVARYNNLIETYNNLIATLIDLGYDEREVATQRDEMIAGFHRRIDRLTNSVLSDINFIAKYASIIGNIPNKQDVTWFLYSLPNYASALVLHDQLV